MNDPETESEKARRLEHLIPREVAPGGYLPAVKEAPAPAEAESEATAVAE
jgi:hypothetical protein